MRFTFFRKMIPLLLAFLLVAGCGAPTAAPTPDNTTPAPSAPAPAPAPEPGNGNTGAASDWDKIVEAAKAEGKVVVAGPPGNTYREALVAFEKAYPEIKVEFTGISGRDFASKLGTEQKVGQYLWDVHVGGTTSVFTGMIPQGLIDVFPRDLPETTPGANDDKWREGFNDGMVDKEQKFLNAFSAYTRHGMFSNKDIIPEDAIKTVEDLLKPEFKGKISWYEPRSGGPGNATAASILRAHGEDFLKKLLTEQEIAFTNDHRQQNEWLVRGRYPIAIGADLQFGLEEFRQQGIGLNVTPVKDPALDELITGYGGVALVNKAPNPNAAKVYINWLLSKEGQTIWSENTKVNSRRLDVPVAQPAQAPEPNVKYLYVAKEEFAQFTSKAGAIAREVIK